MIIAIGHCLHTRCSRVTPDWLKSQVRYLLFQFLNFDIRQFKFLIFLFYADFEQANISADVRDFLHLVVVLVPRFLLLSLLDVLQVFHFERQAIDLVLSDAAFVLFNLSGLLS